MRKTTRKMSRYFLIIFFTLFIYIPIFGLLFNIQDGLENTEKRNLAALPKIGAESGPAGYTNFTDEFLQYFEDNFGFRYTFMRLASNLKIRLFKTYPRNVDIKVLRGKDSWLFYKPGNETEDFEGRVPFSKEKIEKILTHNKIRAKKLAEFKEHGANFYILVPPDKTVVYSEFLPENILEKENIQNSRIAGLLDANQKADQKTGLKIIYPKDILLQNKDRGRLYFAKDTHWTYLGAYFGYVELLRTIQKDYRDAFLKPLNIEDFKKEEYIYDRPDLANMVNIGKKNTEKSYRYLCNTYGGRGKSSLRVLVFGDSFYENLDPYLKCTFKEVKFINSNTISKKAIKEFEPDIVILEIVQRNIRQLEVPDNR